MLQYSTQVKKLIFYTGKQICLDIFETIIYFNHESLKTNV